MLTGAWNGDSWLGCGDFLAVGLYSIWGLAGHSGGPWMPQAPTLHLSAAVGIQE